MLHLLSTTGDVETLDELALEEEASSDTRREAAHRPARYFKSKWTTHITDRELEKVITHREYMINPHQNRMQELTCGKTFGLLRPSTVLHLSTMERGRRANTDEAADGLRRPQKRRHDSAVYNFRTPSETRPFAQMVRPPPSHTHTLCLFRLAPHTGRARVHTHTHTHIHARTHAQLYTSQQSGAPHFVQRVFVIVGNWFSVLLATRVRSPSHNPTLTQ
jgi:hypothetical protein